MFDLQKAIIDLLSSKVGEFAGQLFYGLIAVLLMGLLGVPFEKYIENFQVMVWLGIGLTSPFAARPIITTMIPFITSRFSAYKGKISIDVRIAKIKDYSASKKKILLGAFLAGKPDLEMAHTQDLAEMTADDVLEDNHFYHKIKPEIWKALNARPDYRDLVLERAELIEGVKAAIDAKKRNRRLYP